MLAFVLFGCGEGNKKKSKSLNLSIKSLSESSGTYQKNALRSVFGVMALDASDEAPVIDGLQITLRDSIVFCKGVYGQDADCGFEIHRFEEDLKIDLTKNVNDQLNITTTTEIEAGTYTHASLRYKEVGEIKAYYHSDADTVVYTTPEGIKTIEASSPGPDYGYLVMTPMYPWLTDSDGYQETTYFETPFVYDGTSEISLKVYVDLLRAGNFLYNEPETPNAWAWKLDYLNIYMTFEDTDAVVETYKLISKDQHDVEHTQILTLVSNSNGELVGGRTRGAGELEQFIKNWNCNEVEECDFEIGDYGHGPNFTQQGRNFKRLNKGDPAAQFEVIKDGVSQNVGYERIDR